MSNRAEQPAAVCPSVRESQAWQGDETVQHLMQAGAYGSRIRSCAAHQAVLEAVRS